MDNKITKLKEAKDTDFDRLQLLKRALQNELEEKARNESAISQLLREREHSKNQDSVGDNNIKTIQFFFEDWYRNVGQFMKKGGGKKLAATA